ncbi:MAG TPA: lipase family protein [Chitinophagaceae bacterium]|nr:lipase family protein [Chitinophagaceae bacterium]
MRIVITSLLLTFTLLCSAQSLLQPGFDPVEYNDLLSLAFHGSSIPDSNERKTKKDRYQLVFRSPEVGLMNRWSLFLREDQVAVINIRGTVKNATSWSANFYAPMIPATGSLQLNDSTVFNYQLAENPGAAVHAGWTIALGHLAPSILDQVNKLYKEKGIRQFIVSGHSQGGAIAFLTRSWLHYEQQKGTVPKEIVFKTYCSAAPKPGNLNYTYDFDYLTRGGWGLTVVNAYDWVPESPFSIQTLTDFNPANPMADIKSLLKKQKFLLRLAGNMVYSKMERKPRKAQRKLEKYLGTKLYKMGIRKSLPQLKEPEYIHTSNYMRAGTPVILMPDEQYRLKFPSDGKDKAFIHHLYASYSYLLNTIYKLN